VIRSRIRAPRYCRTACPTDAHSSTTNSAPSDTHTEGAASPSRRGESQIPKNPPTSSPAVANAPVTNPCQYPETA
jgi:hypothetical protein